MDNMENILDQLSGEFVLSTPLLCILVLQIMCVNNYERQKGGEIPKLLEEYICHLAKTGETLFPWPKIRGLIRQKLELVITAFREACPTESLPPCPNVEPFHYETVRDKILEQFDSFNCAPFTIQRLCELLCAPRKHYKRTDKFMRGIEKNLLVVSTVDPEQSGRKRSESVSSSQPLVNGIVELNSGPNNRSSTPSSLVSAAATAVDKKTEHRPSSAASDVASVSDGDSGISDTEDEEKPFTESQRQELPPQTADEANDRTSVVPQLAPPGDETEPSVSVPVSVRAEDPVPPAEAVVAESASEPVDNEPLMDVTEGESSAGEGTVTTKTEVQESIAEEQPQVQPPEEPRLEPSDSTETPVLVQNTETDLVSEAIPAPVSDKKRPLEKEEDVEFSPDAKQPRYFSPDKVLLLTQIYVVYSKLNRSLYF
nr:EOG090X0BWU [Ilyocryptus agilis]